MLFFQIYHFLGTPELQMEQYTLTFNDTQPWHMLQPYS